MSAKGRSKGAASGPQDYYPTPAWAVNELLRRCHNLPGGVWCEPAVGNGAIVRAVEAMRPGRQVWLLNDLREERLSEAADACPELTLIECDQCDFMLAPPSLDGAAVYITNPPFSLAEQFARECMRRAGPTCIVALLLRVGFLGSNERVPFWAANPADIYTLCPRPSFSPNGRTDASEYGWFLWTPESRARGYSRVLHPKEPAPDAPRKKRKGGVVRPMVEAVDPRQTGWGWV